MTMRVVLADDHPALRLGLRVLLEQSSDIDVVGEASRGEEAITLVQQLQPDVLVLDCELPGMSGPEVAATLRARNTPTRILALSAFSDDDYIRSMLEAGAVGYLLKSEAAEHIVAAVRAAARGEGYFSPPIARKVAAWVSGEERKAPTLGALTSREMDVLRLVARGWTNTRIAQTLDITERTVEFHLTNILRKLGVSSRVEAALWAKDRGLG